jgi:hypothetical protein
MKLQRAKTRVLLGKLRTVDDASSILRSNRHPARECSRGWHKGDGLPSGHR